MTSDPFESGKAAGERTASDYIKWSQSVYEIQKDGIKRIAAIYSRLQPIFDEIGFPVSNIGTSISISSPEEGGPRLSIEISGEYISGHYVCNSDKYLVKWEELKVTNGLGEFHHEDKCDIDRVFEIAGTFYGNWKHRARPAIQRSPTPGNVSSRNNSSTKNRGTSFGNVMLVAILLVAAYLWFF